MDKKVISAASAPAAGPYSPGLQVGELVFLAGQTGKGDTLEQQIDAALGKVEALLGEVGCTLDDVVSCLVHLADLSLRDRYNAAYERHFAEPRPVRTTVRAGLIGGALVEFTVIARRG